MFSSKCAEVFCQSYENFAIVCTDCNLKTNKFNEFILHYQKIHCNLQPIKQEEIKEKIQETKPVNVFSIQIPDQADTTEVMCPAKIAEIELGIKNENCQFEDEFALDEKTILGSDDDIPLKAFLNGNPLENEQFTCSKCGKKYSSRASLRTHLHRNHPDVKLPRLNAGDSTFSCSLCTGKIFSSYKALHRHKCRKHPQVADNSKTTINPVKPIEILCIANTSTNETDIKTEICHLENENEIDENIVSDSDDDWPLQEFVKKNSDESSQISCPVCDRKYEHRTSFQMHLRRHHPDIKMPRLNAANTNTTCVDCPEKTYSTNKALQRHRREKHTNETIDNFQCPHCEKQFKTKRRVTVHMRYVHKVGRNDMELKRYPCTQCDRVFSERYLLKRHETRHSGIRSIICPVSGCGMAFYDVKSMGAHRRIVHFGTRKFVCDICGFSTKTASSLQSHLRTHTGEKPFKCDQCDKCFTTSAAVIEHKIIHNSHIRPHVCDVCGKAFARPKALYHHKPLHLGIKKFVCKICGKAYAQQAGLSAHKRQHLMDNFGDTF